MLEALMDQLGEKGKIEHWTVVSGEAVVEMGSASTCNGQAWMSRTDTDG
jgi:hypothetical protein